MTPLHPTTTPAAPPSSSSTPEPSFSSTLRTRRRRTPSLTSTDSRQRSPIPAAHPQRASKPAAAANARGNGNGGWGSQWGSLQSLASAVLGDSSSSSSSTSISTNGAPSNSNTKKNPPKKKGGAGNWFSELLADISGPPPPEYTRQAYSVYPRGRRRADEAPTEWESPAAAERRRRKRVSTSPPPGEGTYEGEGRGRAGNGQDEQDEQALVYIFPVSTTDTLERVVLAFDTTPAAVRRANGLWPGDSIQSRKELMVPVDGCGVKGVPISTDQTPSQPTQSRRNHADVDTGERKSNAVDAGKETGKKEKDTPYTPLHPVSIPSLPDTHILLARLPYRKLGYFPRPRTRSHPQTHAPTPQESPPTSPRDLDPFGTAGVRPLHPEVHPQTAEGLSNSLLAAAAEVEGFVRRWTKRVGDAGENMIELTTRLVEGEMDGDAHGGAQGSANANGKGKVNGGLRKDEEEIDGIADAGLLGLDFAAGAGAASWGGDRDAARASRRVTGGGGSRDTSRRETSALRRERSKDV